MNRSDSTTKGSIDSTHGGVAGGDLATALRREPWLLQDRSAFLDLVQADYRRVCERDSPWPPDRYCATLPLGDRSLLSSVRRMVEVERFLAENPSLLSFAEPSCWPAEGQSFGEFQLETEIGRGAASRVFLARQPALGGRRVVVKVTTLVRDEAVILGRADHCGVAPVHATGRDESSGLHWICMPFLGTRTLHDELLESRERNTRLPGLGVDRSLAIAALLSDALAYLEGQGVWHGDLKPTNLLLTDGDQPVLIDFNLSQRDTFAQAVVGGTLPYMAPEVIRQLDAGADSKPTASCARSDLFSFGCLLFEMLAGEPWVSPSSPRVTSVSAMEVLELQAQAREAFDDRLAHALPEIRAFVSECLAPTPADRPKSFSAANRTVRLLHARRVRDRRLRRLLGYAAAVVVATVVGIVTLRVASPSEADLVAAARGFVAKGAHTDAIESLSRCAAAGAFGREVLWLRGQALLGSDRPLEAAAAFVEASALSPEAASLAMAGYAFQCAGRHEEGVTYARRAIEAGDRSAAVANNLAAGLLRRLIDHFDSDVSQEVEEHLTEAGRLDPTSDPIVFNKLHHAEVLRAAGESVAYSTDELMPTDAPSANLQTLQLAGRWIAATGSVQVERLGECRAVYEALAERLEQRELLALLGAHVVRRLERISPEAASVDRRRGRTMGRSESHPALIEPNKEQIIPTF
ncbi:MAG: protein kinase domain-containing protein [Lacipirellulaceae bacterium]